MNVAAGFDRQARETPAARALHGNHGTTHYGELREQVRQFALQLAERGVATGDRVALLLPNHPAFAVALLGTHWLGAVATVLSPAWAAADAAKALAQADPCLLVTTRELARVVGVELANTLLVDDEHDAPAVSVSPCASRGTGMDAPAPRSASDPASILFSSGTTSEPKGVVLTHGNLIFNAAAKRRYCGIRPTDRLALVVPASHCFGQNVVILGALLAGACVRISPRFDAAETARDILAGDVTMLMAAPPAFARLLALGDDAPLRALRYALTAAARVPDALAARWHEASGRPLSQGYGLTECSPFATYRDAVTGDGQDVGRAIEGVDVRIADQESGGRWLPAGEPGEIVIRGRNVMAGYWRRPDATAHALRGGWLRTGDVGTLDATGCLRVIDRVDDMINVAGFKAWPSDIERVLATHPLVAEAAAYGIPDAARGRTVAAAVVLRAGASAEPCELAAFAAARLATFQRPTMLRVVDALPRSPAGKVLRRALSAEHQGMDHASPTNAERPATDFPAPSR